MANYIEASQSRHNEIDSMKFKLILRNGRKGHLNNFDYGIIVGDKQPGLSISEIAYILGFSCTTISKV